MNNPVFKFLYRFKVLRQLGKKILRNKTIYQPFYNGVICFNAVEFGLFWFNDKTCENMDKEIQDKLLALSIDKDHFIDIGSNIGIMTLTVALRNPRINVTAYDPNRFISAYLKKSIKKNKLDEKVSIVIAAVSDKAGTAYMDFSTGPYSGHLADKGTKVDVIDFGSLLKKFRDKKTLFKLDIEGFERNLIPVLVKEKNPAHCFVIEIHPKGLNGISDPDFVLQQLYNNDYTLTDVNGKKVNTKADIIDWGNIVCYYEKKSNN